MREVSARYIRVTVQYTSSTQWRLDVCRDCGNFCADVRLWRDRLAVGGVRGHGEGGGRVLQRSLTCYGSYMASCRSKANVPLYNFFICGTSRYKDSHARHTSITADAMASFNYAPLDQSTRSIRLLRFEEQSMELDLVCCSLETHKLDHCPPYAALSYVWGEAEEAGGGTAKGILVDGRPFLARPNLHAALCAMRGFEDRDRLWIKTSTALSDFTSYQTDLPDLMKTLKSYTPKHKWQAVIRKVLRTDCIMIRNADHRYNHVDRQLAHWDIFQSIMGCYEPTWNCGDTTQRVEWSHRYYWIDAICIDQENDLERGHQVNMMGDIYGGAACVIAWLDPSSAGSDQVMPAASGQVNMYPRGSNISLKGICNHPYWSRLWTAQEYILARDVLLICGGQEVPLGEVQALAIADGEGKDSPMSWRMEARNRWRRLRTIPLDMLLEQLAVAPCSDPRDRVYGILSLLGTQSEATHHLQADYTISEKQLYYRVLGRRLLSASHRTTLRRLTMAGRRAILRLALGVADDDDFKMNDLLYQIVEFAQEQALEFNPDLIDDPRMASHREILRSMSDSSPEPGKRDHGGQDPLAVYSEVTNIFSGFPKKEDSLTWEKFDKLLRQELGLESGL